MEFFNLLNRSNPGANYVTNIAALPVNNLANVTGLCLNAVCTQTQPITNPNHLRIPRRGLERLLPARDHGRHTVRGPTRRAPDLLKVASAANIGFFRAIKRAAAHHLADGPCLMDRAGYFFPANLLRF